MKSLYCCLILTTFGAACARLESVGQAPQFSDPQSASAYYGAVPASAVEMYSVPAPAARASLWSGAKSSLLGDRRAERQGDILTVVIQIDEKAEISNSTERSRNGSESLALPDLFGIPQQLNKRLPDGASFDSAVSTTSSSTAGGDGSVRRNEKLTLRIAATVVGVLPNGILRIEGSQEIRVNFEIRELLVDGYVRPEDISRQNEVTYDKIASARISYGGRGQITDVQQPRYGQQIADILLPF